MNNSLEAYAKELANQELPFDIFAPEQPMTETWEYWISHNIYKSVMQKDVNGKTFTDMWLNYIENRVDNDSTLNADTLSDLILVFHTATWKILKWFVDHKCKDQLLLLQHIGNNTCVQEWVQNMLILTKDVYFTRMFYYNTLGEGSSSWLNHIMLNTILSNKLPIQIIVPEGFHAEMYLNRFILQCYDMDYFNNIFIPYYKYLILRYPETVYLTVLCKRYVCDEFYEIIPKVTIDILMNKPKEEITQESYQSWKDVKHIPHPSFLYIEKYLEAPPIWMCPDELKEAIGNYCIRYNIIPPIYLDTSECLSIVSCSHENIELWYADVVERTIKCDKCAVNKSVKVYNVRCPICLNNEPAEVHLYNCGHTVCKYCFEECNTCQYCCVRP